MHIEITTPALLFPAISLLLLAFTNRFVAAAALIRSLHERYHTTHEHMLVEQIRNLRYRVVLIRNMQVFGVSSLFACVACMFLLFAGLLLLGQIVFALSLVLMLVSLGLSVREIQVSVDALNLQIRDLEEMRVFEGR